MTKVDSPIQIGSFTVKNRITFAPTVKFDFTDDSGLVQEAHVRHYAERAGGGCGLICVEATAVVPGGRFCKTHLGLWNDEQTEGHKAITAACHEAGAVVIIQLNHAGYSAGPDVGKPVGPSAITRKGFMGDYTTVALSLSEVRQMQDAFVAAAVRAKEAGYDGVQFHGCHGYLINQFVSPTNNLREDEYGGTTKNRAAFCREMIERVRKLCGPDFLISVRTSGYEPTVSEAIAVAREYVEAGCDYLQVSNGLTSLETLPAFRDPKVTDIQSLGAYFKEAFDGIVPVSCVGGIKTPEDVRYLIENEYVDTVDVARAVLADPNFANAVLEGSPYTPCFGCKMCQFGPFTKHTCPAEQKRGKGN